MIISPENSKTKESRQIDIKIATYLGFTNIKYNSRWGTYSGNGPSTKGELIVPHYSLGVSAAWKLVSFLKSKGLTVYINTNTEKTRVRVAKGQNLSEENLADVTIGSESNAIATAFVTCMEKL
jgi:hypothetical protein